MNIIFQGGDTVKTDDFEVVTIKIGSVFFVARVIVSGEDRYPMHWNEARNKTEARGIAANLAKP